MQQCCRTHHTQTGCAVTPGGMQRPEQPNHDARNWSPIGCVLCAFVQVFPITEVLQPCCKPMEKLLNGADGLIARAPKGTIQEKAYNFLAAKVKVCGRL